MTRVSDSWLKQGGQFLAILWREQVTFRGVDHDDHVHFELKQKLENKIKISTIGDQEQHKMPELQPIRTRKIRTYYQST